MTAGLRRTMLTAGKAEVRFGWPVAGYSSLLGGQVRLYITRLPAPVAGTVASVEIPLQTATSVAFFSVHPTTFVVTAISSTVSHPGGLATFAVSFAVNAGDLLGLWVSGTGSNGPYRDEVSGFYPAKYRFSGSAFAKPVAGTNLTASLSGGVNEYPLHMQATLA